MIMLVASKEIGLRVEAGVMVNICNLREDEAGELPWAWGPVVYNLIVCIIKIKKGIENRLNSGKCKIRDMSC